MSVRVWRELHNDQRGASWMSLISVWVCAQTMFIGASLCNNATLFATVSLFRNRGMDLSRTAAVESGELGPNSLVVQLAVRHNLSKARVLCWRLIFVVSRVNDDARVVRKPPHVVSVLGLDRRKERGVNRVQRTPKLALLPDHHAVLVGERVEVYRK